MQHTKILSIISAPIPEVLLVLTILFLGAQSGYADGALFDPAINYPVGSNPISVLAADLNGDSIPDLAVANHHSDNVSILLNSDSTFQAAINYAAGNGPFSVFAGDLDGDGCKDLAVANAVSDDVSILLNNCEGIFTQNGAYAIGDHAYSVFVADLDGDGHLDLAVANAAAGTLSILINNGDGTFQDTINYPVVGGPYSVIAADLNGSGHLDLATANPGTDNVSILFNNGDGTFQDTINYPVGDAPFDVFAADLDGNGHLDLATANQQSDNASVLLNHGDGTFSDAVHYPAGDGPQGVTAADFDGDGDSDLAVANPLSDDVTILLNNGDGTFALDSAYTVGSHPWGIFASDLDLDGDSDLAVACYYDNSVSILENLTGPYTRPDTLFVGNSAIEPSCMEAELPIYLANQEPVSAGHIVLDYSEAGWPFHPSDVSFAGTRVESWNPTLGVIDSTTMTIDIGFFNLSGTPLDPADEITRDIPIAKIMFNDECAFAGEMWLQPPDTTTLCAEFDCFSTSLVDTLGVLYAPDVTFDSTKISGYVPGDADGSCTVDIDDVVYVINYIFMGGPAPVCESKAGDANGSCGIDIDDVVYLIAYIFAGGPEPVPYCYIPLPFEKTIVGNASLSIAGNANEESSTISLTADRDVQAIQLEFAVGHDVVNVRVESLVDGIETFYGYSGGVLRIGLLDLYGTHMIPAGSNDIVQITGANGKLELTNSIIVAKGGGHLNSSVSEQASSGILPLNFALNQNHPNPFNPTTEISFSLPSDSYVKLEIHNIMGQRVTTLVDDYKQAGYHTVTWSGRDDGGASVASGVYFYRIEAGEYSDCKKMLLMK
ncbi:MAG: VCBS repeat-containing protein [candidate division Zixibacteria bacterium]|nr:VCBS repeat-containing protein [candidate division Zixibacteria bacterium]MBU1471010.1 VCBS repeat-containing protein [candidate division Zixibacteria bacterium]